MISSKITASLVLLFIMLQIQVTIPTGPPGFKCSTFIPTGDKTETNMAIAKIPIPSPVLKKETSLAEKNDTEWLNAIKSKNYSEVKVNPPAYAIARSNFSISVYDESNTLQFTYLAHNGRINQIISIPANDKHGIILASSSDDQSVLLFDLSTRAQVLKFTGHTAAVKTITYIDTYNFMASGSEDGQVLFWDLERGAVEGRVKDIQEFAPYSLAHIKGTENLIIGTGLNIKFFHMRKYPGIIKLANLGRNGRVDSLAYIDDSDYVAAASSSIGIVSFFNHQDKAEMPTSFKDIESGGVAPNGLLYIPDHKLIVAVGKARSGKSQHTLKIWKLRINKNYAPFFMAYNYASFTNFDRNTPSGQAIYLDGQKKLVLLMEHGIMTYNLTHLPLLSFHGDCYAPCPVETFPVKTQCAACDSSCLTCTGPKQNQCSFCKNDKKFFHHNCLTTCPINTAYLAQNQTCVCKENFSFDNKLGVCVEIKKEERKVEVDYNMNYWYIILIVVPILAFLTLGGILFCVFCKKWETQEGTTQAGGSFAKFANDKPNPEMAYPQIKVGTPEPKETVFTNVEEEEVQTKKLLAQRQSSSSVGPSHHTSSSSETSTQGNPSILSPRTESILKKSEEVPNNNLTSPKVLVSRSGAIMMDLDHSFGFDKTKGKPQNDSEIHDQSGYFAGPEKKFVRTGTNK